MSFSTTTIPDECCTKTCLNPFLSLHNFFTFFIVLLHIVSTVLQYMNTVYTNVDPACITDCGYKIVVSSPFVLINIRLYLQPFYDIVRLFSQPFLLSRLFSPGSRKWLPGFHSHFCSFSSGAVEVALVIVLCLFCPYKRLGCVEKEQKSSSKSTLATCSTRCSSSTVHFKTIDA